MLLLKTTAIDFLPILNAPPKRNVMLIIMYNLN